MSTSINTNVTAMAAIRSLSTISMDMTRTQARVESGLRINQANDDPAVFAIAQRMRADLNGMNAVKDSLAFGKSALTVARDAATKISDELGKLKQTITQGQQQGLNKTQIDTQIQNALANIDAYANSATFNGVNMLLAGPGGAVTDVNLNVVRDIEGATTTFTGVDSTSAGLGLTGLAWNSGAQAVSFDNAFVNDGTAVANGMNITVSDGTTTWVFEMNDGTAALTAQPSPTQRVLDVQFAGTDSPMQIVANIVERMQGEGLGAMLDSQGRLVVAGNISTATTDITGATVAALPAGTEAITAVNGAIDLMGTRLANLGATLRQVEGLGTFTKQLFDSLREGLGSLVDADLSEESARLTSLQTKQQLAVQSLSIANQAPQSLLSLFRG